MDFAFIYNLSRGSQATRVTLVRTSRMNVYDRLFNLTTRGTAVPIRNSSKHRASSMASSIVADQTRVTGKSFKPNPFRELIYVE